MSNLVKFYLDQQGVQNVIYNENTHLSELERQAMEQALAEVKASFLQEFGFDGQFELYMVRTKVGGRGANYVSGTRPVYRIKAGDARTGAVLKAHPQWLDRFSKSAKL